MLKSVKKCDGDKVWKLKDIEGKIFEKVDWCTQC